VKRIQILGTGCYRCKKLAENTRTAVRELGLDCEIDKITDIAVITGFGVMMTPALAVDGEVKSSGKVLSPDEIKKILERKV
jgi:small redox-active disulfide protein 2